MKRNNKKTTKETMVRNKRLITRISTKKNRIIFMSFKSLGLILWQSFKGMRFHTKGFLLFPHSRINARLSKRYSNEALKCVCDKSIRARRYQDNTTHGILFKYTYLSIYRFTQIAVNFIFPFELLAGVGNIFRAVVWLDSSRDRE